MKTVNEILKAVLILTLVSSLAYGVQYISKIGSHDIEWGSGSWVDNNLRTRYRVSATDVPFAQDNAIKVGNANLYGLSSGVIGSNKIIYVNNTGAISVIALDNAGLILTSGGPTSAPYFGPGSSLYNPAAVAIIGGSINGVNVGNTSGVYLNSYTQILGAYVADGSGIRWGSAGSQYYSIDQLSTSGSMNFNTPMIGATTTDNVPMWRFTTGASLEPAQSVLGIRKGSTAVLDVYGNGNINTPGVVSAGGVNITVLNGYRRMNVCNTGGLGSLLFSPQGGDIACVDNVVYIYSAGQWSGISTGAGEGTTPPLFSTSDNFNRTNADPEGNDWASVATTREPKISGNTLMMGAGGGGSNMLAYFDNAATFANNQWSQVKINTLGEGGPAVRVQGDLESGYVLSTVDASTVTLYRMDEGASTQLGSPCSGTFANSDTFKITASGSTITAYQNGTAISGCSATDATYTGGNPGVELWGATGAADDWAGGDL